MLTNAKNVQVLANTPTHHDPDDPCSLSMSIPVRSWYGDPLLLVAEVERGEDGS